jgi:hypothetical protein
MIQFDALRETDGLASEFGTERPLPGPDSPQIDVPIPGVFAEVDGKSHNKNL